MKCKIVKSVLFQRGKKCTSDEWDWENWFGFLVHTYKPRLLFGGYKRDRIIKVKFVDGDDTTFINTSFDFINTHTEEDMFKIIIDTVKKAYGISDDDIKEKDNITILKNSLNGLVGKEFEIPEPKKKAR